jgi:phytoene dehydrogenase-like protein
MTGPIESQIERFAPGFRDLILERTTRGPIAYEKYNPNCVGGDIGGGAYGLGKVLQIGRKAPYELGGNVYLCSSATPPGAESRRVRLPRCGRLWTEVVPGRLSDDGEASFG